MMTKTILRCDGCDIEDISNDKFRECPWCKKPMKVMNYVLVSEHNKEIDFILSLHPDAKNCPIDECSICAYRDCPHHEPLHYHHDGCPACYDNELSLSRGEDDKNESI